VLTVQSACTHYVVTFSYIYHTDGYKLNFCFLALKVSTLPAFLLLSSQNYDPVCFRKKKRKYIFLSWIGSRTFHPVKSSMTSSSFLVSNLLIQSNVWAPFRRLISGNGKGRWFGSFLQKVEKVSIMTELRISRPVSLSCEQSKNPQNISLFATYSVNFIKLAEFPDFGARPETKFYTSLSL